jgi:hypothetical protein
LSNSVQAGRQTRPTEVPGAFVVNGFPLLEFDRKPIDRHFLRGFVIDGSPQLSLVQILDCDSFRLDGYAVIRNADVRRWRAIPEDNFLARAARLHKLRPSKPDTVNIASLGEAAASAGAAFPLITIHCERIDKGACYVGRMLLTDQRAVTILYLSPEAEWEEAESYSLRDITLLEFGGAYEGLLARMAEKLP